MHAIYVKLWEGATVRFVHSDYVQLCTIEMYVRFDRVKRVCVGADLCESRLLTTGIPTTGLGSRLVWLVWFKIIRDSRSVRIVGFIDFLYKLMEIHSSIDRN